MIPFDRVRSAVRARFAVRGALLVCLATAPILPAWLAAQEVPAPAAGDGSAPAVVRPRPARPRPMGSAQEEAGEPRADTSIAGAGAVDSAAPAAGPPAPAPPAAAGAVPASHPTAAHAAPVGGRRGPASADHVDLDTTTVTGNREQPKVMYVVPWKKSDIGDVVAKPMNSLLDEVLAPVDRDEFRREVSYYQAVKSDADAAGRGPGGAVGTPASQAGTNQGEK